MNEKEKIEQMIAEFMQGASPAEMAEFKRLLEERQKAPRGLGNINFNALARSMAASIKTQMGITEQSVQQTARTLVRSLAKKHKPDISDPELDGLVELMVPSGSGRQSGTARQLPRDVLLSMVRHIVDYGKGRLSPAELKDLPQGWVEKYWGFFPPEIRRLIDGLMKDRLEEGPFWQEVNRLLPQ